MSGSESEIIFKPHGNMMCLNEITINGYAY